MNRKTNKLKKKSQGKSTVNNPDTEMCTVSYTESP